MMSTLADAVVFVSSAAGFSILLKATLFLALGLSGAWLARRGRASMRHLLLALTFATLLALPCVVLLGPAVAIEIPVASGRHATTAPNTTVGSVPSPVPVNADTVRGRTTFFVPSWSMLALGVWFCGAAALMILLAFDLWRIRRIVRNGLPWVDPGQKVSSRAVEGVVRRAVDVLRHEDVVAPFTCGMWRPAIVLPTSATAWTDADLDRALVHELEHVRRLDWAIQVAARVACACYWFHPLVWMAWRRLCLEAERACDDAVVQQAESTDYAEQLVSMAQRMSSVKARPVLGMANRSDLASRIASLLDDTRRRGRAGARAAAGAICAAVVIGGAIAPLRGVGVSLERNVISGESVSAQSQNTEPRSRKPPNRLHVALFETAAEGDIDAMTKLLEAGADVNAAISGDGSPLIGAARAGHLDAVRLLLDRGADIDMGVPGDGNALIMAAREGHAAVVSLLLERGASVDHVVPGDENALIQASGNGRLDVVKLLVSREANVNARIWAPRSRNDGEWRTPISMARRNRHVAVVEFLRSVGAVE
jgi:beta-lactamase regulating signal transducer with metallopeptidase domain